MKIAFLYMDMNNLGDLVIRDTARYLLQSVLDENQLADAEVVLVDTGECSYKLDPEYEKETFHSPVSKFLSRYAKSRRVFRNFPFLAQEMLIRAWHESKHGRYFREKEMPKLRGADLIVFCGGGLIKFRKQACHYVLHDVTRYAQKMGIPVIMNSVGVEGYSEEQPGCKILKRALNRPCVKYISVRDDYDTLMEHFIENPAVETAQVCDPAWWSPETYGARKRSSKPGEPKVVGINSIRPAIFEDYGHPFKLERLDALYHGLTEKLLAQGYHVDFFSNGVMGDSEYIDHLFETFPEMANDDRITVSLPQTPEELVNLISGYDRYMAVRLHASIVGTSLGVPNVSLVWNVKQTLFGKILGLRRNYITQRGFDADTVFDRLMAAEPYQTNEPYKNSVRETLSHAIREYGRMREKPMGIAWLAMNLGIGVKGFVGDVHRVFSRRYQRVRKRRQSEAFERNMRAIAQQTPTNSKKIAIMTNTSRYTCNPKYIYEELVRRGDDFDIVWLVKDLANTTGYPEGTRVVQYDTEEGIREAFSAKLWLDNGIAFSDHFDKKPDQLHIQTMHGSLGIKNLDNAVLSRNASGARGQLVVQRESANTNYVITNSKFEEDVFRRVFWKETPMMRMGHARTDILFEDDPAVIGRIRNTLRDEYGIPVDCKLALFAPTYRKGLTADDVYIDYPRLKAILEKKFGGEFAVMVRLHNRTKNLDLEGLDNPFVYDVSDYPDMQEIMLVSEIGITDYSSWIFDYVVTKRPGFHYVTDIGWYLKKTGLAYPIDQSPFPYALTHEALMQEIENFDNDAFMTGVEAFLEDKQAVDDGHSAERIADFFEELLGEGVASQDADAVADAGASAAPGAGAAAGVITSCAESRFKKYERLADASDLQKPGVAVIVPVYNAEDHLRQCLDSILAQTFTDFELVCVDDGSTDSSPAILSEYAAADKRVRVVRQENRGAGAARNTGIASSNSDYLVFWDSDDYFDSTALETMYKLSQEKNADVCVCSGKQDMDEGAIVAPAPGYMKRKYLPETMPFSRFDWETHIFDFTTATVWNKMFKRSFVEAEDLHFTNRRTAEDVPFVLPALAMAMRIMVTPKQLINHRVGRPGSLFSELSANPSEQIDGWIDARKELEAHHALPVDSFMRKATAAVCSLLLRLNTWESFSKAISLLKEYGMHELLLDDIREPGFYNAPWQREALRAILEKEPEEVAVMLMSLNATASRKSVARLRAKNRQISAKGDQGSVKPQSDAKSSQGGAKSQNGAKSSKSLIRRVANKVRRLLK